MVAISSFVFAFNGQCQCASVPSEFVLENAEDYAAYEGVSFELMNCLVTRPMEFSLEEKDEATAFCLIWLGGTPNYIISVDTKAVLFLDENPDFLYTYIFALALVEKDFPKYGLAEKEAEALYLVAQHEKGGECKKRCKSLKKVEKLYLKGKLVIKLEKLRTE